MSSIKQAAIEGYRSLPGHYKVEVRDIWCENMGVGKKTLDNRLAGAYPFSPKELAEFARLVDEYKEFLANLKADQEETEQQEPVATN